MIERKRIKAIGTMLQGLGKTLEHDAERTDIKEDQEEEVLVWRHLRSITRYAGLLLDVLGEDTLKMFHLLANDWLVMDMQKAYGATSAQPHKWRVEHLARVMQRLVEWGERESLWRAAKGAEEVVSAIKERDMSKACEHSAQSWYKNTRTDEMFCDDCGSVIENHGGVWIPTGKTQTGSDGEEKAVIKDQEVCTHLDRVRMNFGSSAWCTQCGLVKQVGDGQWVVEEKVGVMGGVAPPHKNEAWDAWAHREGIKVDDPAGPGGVSYWDGEVWKVMGATRGGGESDPRNAHDTATPGVYEAAAALVTQEMMPGAALPDGFAERWKDLWRALKRDGAKLERFAQAYGSRRVPSDKNEWDIRTSEYNLLIGINRWGQAHIITDRTERRVGMVATREELETRIRKEFIAADRRQAEGILDMLLDMKGEDVRSRQVAVLASHLATEKR